MADTTWLTAGVAALVGSGATGVAVWVQQRNRRQDKIDADSLNATTLRVADTVAALNAWQAIVAANNLQLLTLQTNINELRGRNETCEELTRALQEKIVELEENLRTLIDKQTAGIKE